MTQLAAAINPVAHIGLAHKVARETAPMRRFLDYEEAVADGYAALVSASRHFDPKRGTSWSFYAWRCISNAIGEGHRRRHYQRRRGPWDPERRPVQLEEELTIEKEPALSGIGDVEAILQLIGCPRRRRIVREIVVDGRPAKSLALELGISPQRVNELRREGLASARRKLERRPAAWGIA